MYKKNNYSNTGFNINQSLEGETIEQKIERVTQNKEPIKDGAPLIYTDKKDGVQAGYNIKTDRFEVAVDAMDRVTRSKIANNEHKAKMEIVKNNEVESTPDTGTDK
ncbi:MAG: hypothetical protein RI980_497 [Bacteroidota bacterium]|jgi:hypothetical protein